MGVDGARSRLAQSFLPSSAVLEMTYSCNHKCLFCSCPWEAGDGAFGLGEELTCEEWKGCIRTLVAMGVANISFSGGEPLLNPDIEEIIEYASACTCEHVETVDGALRFREGPPKLYLVSNGTLMRAEILELCRRHSINLSMSLPGLATYREHTGAGSPETVLSWFRRARELGVSSTVNVAVTRKNLPELYETIGTALVAGADTLLINRFLPGGRGIKFAGDLSLSAAEIVEMLDTTELVLRTARRYGFVGTELPRCLVDESRYEYLEVGTRCSAAVGFFVVGPSGYVRTCNHSPVRLNHISDIEALKSNPYWRRFTLKDYLPTSCEGCGEMAECDGGCREAAHIVGGSLDSPDPVFSSEVPVRVASDCVEHSASRLRHGI
jgi:radical SAM protein with 4Fe4S-binding SPASM domain